MSDARNAAGGAETGPPRPGTRGGEATGPATPPSNAWNRLKARWGVTNWGMVAIILAFSLAGSAVLRIGRPIVDAILPENTPMWLWWTVKVVVIVPIYEVLLVSFGTLLGQGPFFATNSAAYYAPSPGCFASVDAASPVRYPRYRHVVPG